MGTLKIRPKIRKVVFTDHQMLVAKETGKFNEPRDFVKWLFRGQHKCEVLKYELLEFKYDKTKVGYCNCTITVTGVIGSSLGWK